MPFVAWTVILILSASLVFTSLASQTEYRAVYHYDCNSYMTEH